MLVIACIGGVFSFILGAVFGSFNTAWIYRTRHGQSMRESHSVCPHCQHHLGVLDLFPIFSYLVLRGRCRYCQHRISSHYVLVELATASLFALTFWHIWQQAIDEKLLFGLQDGWGWVMASLLVAWLGVVLLVALFDYDLRWGELPNQWTLGGSLVVLLVTLAASMTGTPLLWQPAGSALHTNSFVVALISGVLAALFFLTIVILSEKILHKPGMGMGDVKLALFLGLWLGFPGIVVALYLAFVFGAVISLLLIAGKRQKFGNSVPFGPFMVGGALLAIWLTPIILNWYNRLWL